MTRYLALLRGVNVGGRHQLPMARLCALCRGIGWRDVRHYIQSGNLIFDAAGGPPRLEAALEAAIADEFGWSIPVMVRSAAVWAACVKGNPFSRASAAEPNRVLLALSKTPPRREAAGELQERAGGGERIAQVGDVLWIHYAGGIGVSKLSPAVLDRAIGSPVTTRNWRTVLELHARASFRKS